MCFHVLLFPKVSAKNNCYCGQKPRESDIAQMISNYKYHMPLRAGINLKYPVPALKAVGAVCQKIPRIVESM